MPGQAPPPQGQEDGSTAILWAIALIFVVAYLVWHFFHEELVSAYLHLKLVELQAYSFFVHKPELLELQNLILSSSPATAGFENTMMLGQLVGTHLRIPLTIFLVFLAVLVYFGNATRVFKMTYSMKTLAENEQVNWPQIAPVLPLNLVKADIDKGPWAMAMTPVQFCKKYNLIDEVRRPRQEGTLRREAERVEAQLRRGEANKIFVLQLGSRFEGLNKVPPYVRALFAIFAARIQGDTQVAADLVLQLNKTSTATQMNFSGVDALCRKYENHKIVKKITESHAYITTVMASMLTAARLDGVQATADFIWLKPLDRRLWYVLNTMGRQTPFVESAGSFSHWRSEKEAGRKLIVPMVESATAALDLALKSMIYHSDSE